MCRGGLPPSPMQLVMSPINTSSSESFYSRRLIFFGAAEDVNEPTLLQLFSRHGDVKGLFLVRSALGLPSGCGYVTMGTAEQAQAAVKALGDSTECAEAEGRLGLLLVQPAASEVQNGNHYGSGHNSCTSPSGSAKDNRTVFFTKVPPTVTSHQLIQLFTACGEVLHVELFTPWPGAKISKGCGLVEFASGDAAAAAVNSLHQAFTWPHSHSPLVVEWVDSKRQQANKANKLNKAAASAAAVQEHPMRRALTIPADKDTTTSNAVFDAGGQFNSTVPTQQYNNRGTPLQRLQPAWAQQTMALGHQALYLQQQLQQAGLMQTSQGLMATDAAWQYRQLQQQQQQQQQTAADANSATASSLYYQRPLQHSNSGGSGTYSYDTSGSLAMTLASTISNASTVMNQSVAQSDVSSSSLAACPMSAAAAAAAAGIGRSDLYGGASVSSPNCSDSALAMTAAAMGMGRLESAWQQLQQQNLMMLQPLANPVDDQSSCQTLLSPNAAALTAAALAQERQWAAAAQLPVSMGTSTAMQTAANGFTAAEAKLLLQQQAKHQQQTGYASLLNGSSGPLQQQWWAQQTQLPQQMQKDESFMIVVPLTMRQLQVMSGILPEVPRITGAQATLTAGGGDGNVQLLLTGRMSDVQSGYSVVSMLLAKMGVDEPLMPAMAQRTGSGCM